MTSLKRVRAVDESRRLDRAPCMEPTANHTLIEVIRWHGVDDWGGRRWR
jgi:hypothetical protein